MKAINEVMLYVKSRNFPVAPPIPLLSRCGEHIIQLTASELAGEDGEVQASNAPEIKYCVRVLIFLPGQELDKIEKKFMTVPLLRDVGVMVGKLDEELRGFSNVDLASRSNPEWDLSGFLITKQFLKDLDDDRKRGIAEMVLQMFEENVTPKIPSFEKSLIHCDCNGLNILVKQDSTGSYKLSGLIDFNDSLKSCRIFDLGICLAYIMIENMEPSTSPSVVDFVGPIIQGYHSVLPLSKDEFDSLYYLVLARCIQSAVNGERTFKAEPWNLYILTTPEKAWKLVDVLLNTTKVEVDRIWKKYVA